MVAIIGHSSFHDSFVCMCESKEPPNESSNNANTGFSLVMGKNLLNAALSAFSQNKDKINPFESRPIQALIALRAYASLIEKIDLDDILSKFEPF